MNSKRKGNHGEREAAAFLRDHGFTAAKRGQQFCGSPNSPDVLGVPGWHLEIKRVEALRLRDAIAQAEGDSRGGRWCILHRWNHGQWLAVLRAEDWLALVRDSLPPQVAIPETNLAPLSAPCGAASAVEPANSNETKPTELR